MLNGKEKDLCTPAQKGPVCKTPERGCGDPMGSSHNCQKRTMLTETLKPERARRQKDG